jgi:hypothetical protein
MAEAIRALACMGPTSVGKADQKGDKSMKSKIFAALFVTFVGAIWSAPMAAADNCWYSESVRNPHNVILTPNTEECFGTEIQLVTQGDEIATLTTALGEPPIVTLTLKCRDGSELRVENYALVDRTTYFPYPSGCEAKNFARVSTINFLPTQIVGKLKIRLRS